MYELKKTIILLTKKITRKDRTKTPKKKYTVIINKNDKKFSYSELKKKVSDIDILSTLHK